MKRIVSFFVAMVVCSMMALASYNLNWYPATPFIKAGQFSGAIVFGDSAAATDSEAALSIGNSFAGLVKSTRTNESQPIVAPKSSKEISDIGSQNLIVVGGPCANPVAAKLLGNPTDCTAGFKPGKWMIKAIQNGTRTYILVAGYSAEDTKNAAAALSAYKINPLKGSVVEGP